VDSALDLGRIAAVIEAVDPDLVALQEVDSMVERTGVVDQTAELASATGMHAAFGSFMPYQGGAYGMAILSRLPPEESSNLRLPAGAEPRTALAVTVVLPGTRTPLRFVGIHFYRTEEERLAQVASLEEQLADDPVPTILAGDFNSRPGSAVLERLESSWVVVDKGVDRLTFPSYAPAREIDFVLLRPRDRFEVLGGEVLEEPVASDHRPVLVDLVVKGSGGPESLGTAILVHGLGRSATSMALLEHRLEGAGFRVVSVDYPSTRRPLEALVDSLASAVESCCEEEADSVHFVTHSMGGILVRAYLASRPSYGGRVVMLSPPNQGSEVVDALAPSPLLTALLGPAGSRLGTDSLGLPAELGPVGFSLGVIAGNRSLNPIGSWLIPGPDDGKVAVERARVEGLSDFLVVPATHTFIMNRQDVADATVRFLREGRFR
jgi:endonuclease/exonuclease/phosphatase family metal-dependent hydrolase